MKVGEMLLLLHKVAKITLKLRFPENITVTIRIICTFIVSSSINQLISVSITELKKLLHNKTKVCSFQGKSNSC